jgi:hypothetical protein
VLAEVLERAGQRRDADALDKYGPRARLGLGCAALLLLDDDHAARADWGHRFDLRRQLGELESAAGLGSRLDVPRSGLYRLAQPLEVHCFRPAYAASVVCTSPFGSRQEEES